MAAKFSKGEAQHFVSKKTQFGPCCPYTRCTTIKGGAYVASQPRSTGLPASWGRPGPVAMGQEAEEKGVTSPMQPQASSVVRVHPVQGRAASCQPAGLGWARTGETPAPWTRDLGTSWAGRFRSMNCHHCHC